MIHLLTRLLMMSFMARFQCMKSRWRHPWILSVSLRYSLTGHNILSGSSGLRWAIPGTVIHSRAWDGSWFLAKKSGYRQWGHHSDVGYFLFRIHTCQTRHLAHVDMITVALKQMLAGTLFSSYAILDQWRHRKFFPYRRLPMRMVVSSMPIELDLDPT